jgi:hypothetical protein
MHESSGGIHFIGIIIWDVTADWLALLLRTWEVPVEILARSPAILTEVVRGLPQSLQTNAGIADKIRPQLLPFISFPILFTNYILHSMRKSLSYWQHR